MEHIDKTKGSGALETGFEWVSTMITSLLIVVVIFSFLFRVVGVSGDSMCNTLYNNDRLILISEFYKPERGDIVVICRAGGEPYIKRVVAIAGDTVDIDGESGKVLLNGVAQEELYVRGGFTPPLGFVGPYTVKEGEIFALGDNRSYSLDSRQLGAFLVDDIVGEAVLRILPLDTIGVI